MAKKKTKKIDKKICPREPTRIFKTPACDKERANIRFLAKQGIVPPCKRCTHMVDGVM